MSPKRNPEADSFTLDGASTTPTASPSPSGTISTPKKRIGIYIPINDEGQLDASRVRNPGDLERVRTALAIKAPETPKPVTINRDFIPQAYSLIELVIQKLGGLFLKWPKELQTEMYFEAEDKTKLIEPTAQVLEKYSPKWIIENQEVAALVAGLSTAINNMVNKGAERYVAKVMAARSAGGVPVQPPKPTNGSVTPQAQ